MPLPPLAALTPCALRLSGFWDKDVTRHVFFIPMVCCVRGEWVKRSWCGALFCCRCCGCGAVDVWRVGDSGVFCLFRLVVRLFPVAPVAARCCPAALSVNGY